MTSRAEVFGSDALSKRALTLYPRISGIDTARLAALNSPGKHFGCVPRFARIPDSDFPVFHRVLTHAATEPETGKRPCR